MEHYRLDLLHGRRPGFDEAPAAVRRRAFGVDYLAIRGLQGGEFYFTRAGWAQAPSLLPRVWYDGERFRHIGRVLAKATGSVYHVPVPHAARGAVGIVVKFCRVAQDVGGTNREAGLLPPEVAARFAGAEFAGPFEEFGHLQRLRARRDATGERFRTMVPLGVYCPPTHYAPWQLGRNEGTYWRYDYALAADQAPVPPERRVTHHWERLYVLLYQWIEGVDLEEAGRNGLLAEADVRAVTLAVSRDLLAAGYAVLDHKARHVIVRPLPASGRLLRRNGRIVYSLVDYELLRPVRGAPAG